MMMVVVVVVVVVVMVVDKRIERGKLGGVGPTNPTQINPLLRTSAPPPRTGRKRAASAGPTRPHTPPRSP